MWGGVRPDILFFLLSLLTTIMTVAQEIQNSSNVKGLLDEIRQTGNEVLEPAIEDILAFLGLSTCEPLKKALGLSYEQLKGKREPDLNMLTVVYRSRLVAEVFYLNDLVEVLQPYILDETQNFEMFIHGFLDEPFTERFGNISEAYRSRHLNIVAVNIGPLLQNNYLRATTYVQFIGERLGHVLAGLVRHGQNPDKIHLIGHSLGAQIASFTGKTFYEVTGYKIGHITGLDPAGPCFGPAEPNMRLQPSDAKFVDVIHTNVGQFGTMDILGHVDFFPNGGAMQASCDLEICSHNRAVNLYSVSVKSPRLFPAINCNDWEDFKNDRCSDEINYMGFGAKPTIGKFYLQTSGEYPFGLGKAGLRYGIRNGTGNNIQDP